MDPIYAVVITFAFLALLLFFNQNQIKWIPINIIAICLGFLVLGGMAYSSKMVLDKLPKHQRKE